MLIGSSRASSLGATRTPCPQRVLYKLSHPFRRTGVVGLTPYRVAFSHLTHDLRSNHEQADDLRTSVLERYQGDSADNVHRKEKQSPAPFTQLNGSGGVTGKRLFQSAINSLDLFEPSELGTIDEEVSGLGFDYQYRDVSEHGGVVYNKPTYEVLKLNEPGRVKKLYVKRRDLLREHRLQPRDLRRVDPSNDLTKSSPSITIRDDVLLVSLGGIRVIATSEKALLFEPDSPCTRKFLDIVVPRLQASASLRQRQPYVLSAKEYFDRSSRKEEVPPPFELEVLEAALTVATGRLDAEVVTVTRRVSQLLTKLPRDITPVNLEELRRIKQALVELENKADAIRNMLEELMDDEDELRELNLSSRPRREERRRQRERDRLERELERAREIKEEIEERRHQDEEAAKHMQQGLPGSPYIGPPPAVSGPRLSAVSPNGTRGSPGGSASSRDWTMRSKAERQERLATLRAKFERARDSSPDGSREREVLGPWEGDGSRGEWVRVEDPEEDIQEAQDALEEMVEQEQEEQELEEVEDLLEYYLQRASATQSEAERLLEGARDLEESIGVSLSARRYEVNRLELTLSIGSFAAAVGAMFAGIFGMNMRSMMESSVISFWGVTLAIVAGCCYIFLAILRYTQRKRIL